MKDTVTIIKSNLSYQQAIFSLLALDSLPNDYVGNQIFRENVTNVWAIILFVALFIMTLKVKRDPLIYLGISAIIGLILGLFHVL